MWVRVINPLFRSTLKVVWSPLLHSLGFFRFSTRPRTVFFLGSLAGLLSWRGDMVAIFEKRLRVNRLRLEPNGVVQGRMEIGSSKFWKDVSLINFPSWERSHIPPKVLFEDDVPFPKGGICFLVPWRVTLSWPLNWRKSAWNPSPQAYNVFMIHDLHSSCGCWRLYVSIFCLNHVWTTLWYKCAALKGAPVHPWKFIWNQTIEVWRAIFLFN